MLAKFTGVRQQTHHVSYCSIGPPSDVGASSFEQDLVKPSLLDVFDRATTMNENKRRTAEPLLQYLQNVSSMSSEEVLRCFRGVSCSVHRSLVNPNTLIHRDGKAHHSHKN